MLRVVDLLALPIFSGFRIASSGDGIYNEICGVGILEWETPEDIYETFNRKDFVFTTQYMTEGNKEHVTAGVKALLRKGASALAFRLSSEDITLKDVLPPEVIAMADKLKIPLLYYYDVYLEDLIFTVRSSLLAKDSNTIALDCLKKLMSEKEENTMAAARNLNPMFYSNLLCLCCIPMGLKYGSREFRQVLDNTLAEYRKTFSGQIPDSESHNSVICCEKCILVIYTSKSSFKSKGKTAFSAEDVLSKFNINANAFAVGASSIKRGLSSIKEAINESITAAVHGALEKEPVSDYNELGSDMVLVPFFNTEIYRDFYRTRLKKINEYDSTHESALAETLMVYADSLLDVKLTASKLYQHPNTIRYRLSRIRELLNVDTSPEGLLELMIFSRIHKTMNLLGEESII